LRLAGQQTKLVGPASLRESGALTDEEFGTQKARVFGISDVLLAEPGDIRIAADAFKRASDGPERSNVPNVWCIVMMQWNT
jgi:hypothetical protein